MKEQSTAKGFAILSAANVITKVLSFLYLPILKNILKDEGYGIYGVAYQVYVFVYVIANSGIPAAISKIVSELSALKNYKDATRTFKMAGSVLFAAGLLMAVLLAALAYPVVNVIGSTKSYMAVLALCPCIFITALTSAYRGYFQGLGNMTPTAVSQVVEQAVNAIFTLSLAAIFMKYGVEAACAGGAAATTISALFSLFILVFYYKKYKSIGALPSGSHGQPAHTGKELLTKILSYGIPITVCIGLQYAGNLIDLGNTVRRLQSAGFTNEEAIKMYGYLNKYLQLVNTPISVVVGLTAVVLPTISAAVALMDKSLLKAKLNQAFRLCFIVSIPAAFGMGILSGPIYDALKFQPGSYLMARGAVIIILMSVVLLQTSVLQGAGRLITVTASAVAGIIVKIAANFIFIAIPPININGAIIGSILGYTVSIILNNIAIRRYLKVRQDLRKQFIKPLFSSVVMSLAVLFIYFLIGGFFHASEGYVLNLVFLFASVAAGGVVYLYTMIYTGGIGRSETGIIPSPVLRLVPGFLKRRL
ncbi:MAG TPA: polysaccharide biosynthesis protein [Clostridia bacterium]